MFQRYNLWKGAHTSVNDPLTHVPDSNPLEHKKVDMRVESNLAKMCKEISRNGRRTREGGVSMIEVFCMFV